MSNRKLEPLPEKVQKDPTLVKGGRPELILYTCRLLTPEQRKFHGVELLSEMSVGYSVANREKVFDEVIRLRKAGGQACDIAATVGLPKSTVGRWLRMAGLGRDSG